VHLRANAGCHSPAAGLLTDVVLTTAKWLFFGYFAWSILYTHLRGKVRHSLAHQLSDHSTFMAPINGFIYLFSRVPTTAYLGVDLFPELTTLNANWRLFATRLSASMKRVTSKHRTHTTMPDSTPSFAPAGGAFI
jgi:hypothetical protein